MTLTDVERRELAAKANCQYSAVVTAMWTYLKPDFLRDSPAGEYLYRNINGGQLPRQNLVHDQSITANRYGKPLVVGT